MRGSADCVWGGNVGWMLAGVGLFLFCRRCGSDFFGIVVRYEKMSVINLSTAEYTLPAKQDKE